MRKTFALASLAAAGYMLYQLLHAASARRNEPLVNESNPGAEPGTPVMTGAGEGTKVTTEDSDGASASHLVGRGVI